MGFEFIAEHIVKVTPEGDSEGHECMELNTCQCSTWYLEPNEDCPIHGNGSPWPPRCMYCGKYMSRKD